MSVCSSYPILYYPRASFGFASSLDVPTFHLMLFLFLFFSSRITGLDFYDRGGDPGEITWTFLNSFACSYSLNSDFSYKCWFIPYSLHLFYALTLSWGVLRNACIRIPLRPSEVAHFKLFLDLANSESMRRLRLKSRACRPQAMYRRISSQKMTRATSDVTLTVPYPSVQFEHFSHQAG